MNNIFSNVAMHIVALSHIFPYKIGFFNSNIILKQKVWT